MISKVRVTVLLTVAVFTLSCTTAPSMTRDQALEQFEPIAELKAQLEAENVEALRYLAPEGFENARVAYENAVLAAQRGDPGRAIRQANAGKMLLQQAHSDAAKSREVMANVLRQRHLTFEAGASDLFPDRLGELDEELRSAMALIERGRIEEAKKQHAALIEGYSELELMALKESTVQQAEAALKRAEAAGVLDSAPKTFGLAQNELKVALSILDADRSQTEKANRHADRAIWLAERSINLSELAKEFQNRDYTTEDTLLWYQDQLARSSEPLGIDLPFNEPNRVVTERFRQAISSLVNSRAELATQQELYRERLSEQAKKHAEAQRKERETQGRFETVQSLFSESEAEVYQLRQNVRLSVHGFYFQPGKSEVEAQNYDLLNKIVRAIETFPSSRILISGHTDSVGDAAVNLRLSGGRAANVANFLIDVGGIDPQRITARGVGEEKPVASNDSADGRARNRRIEVLLVNPKQPVTLGDEADPQTSQPVTP